MPPPAAATPSGGHGVTTVLPEDGPQQQQGIMGGGHVVSTVLPEDQAGTTALPASQQQQEQEQEQREDDARRRQREKRVAMGVGLGLGLGGSALVAMLAFGVTAAARRWRRGRVGAPAAATPRDPHDERGGLFHDHPATAATPPHHHAGAAAGSWFEFVTSRLGGGLGRSPTSSSTPTPRLGGAGGHDVGVALVGLGARSPTRRHVAAREGGVSSAIQLVVGGGSGSHVHRHRDVAAAAHAHDDDHHHHLHQEQSGLPSGSPVRGKPSSSGLGVAGGPRSPPSRRAPQLGSGASWSVGGAGRPQLGAWSPTAAAKRAAHTLAEAWSAARANTAAMLGGAGASHARATQQQPASAAPPAAVELTATAAAVPAAASSSSSRAALVSQLLGCAGGGPGGRREAAAAAGGADEASTSSALHLLRGVEKLSDRVSVRPGEGEGADTAPAGAPAAALPPPPFAPPRADGGSSQGSALSTLSGAPLLQAGLARSSAAAAPSAWAGGAATTKPQGASLLHGGGPLLALGPAGGASHRALCPSPLAAAPAAGSAPVLVLPDTLLGVADVAGGAKFLGFGQSV